MLDKLKKIITEFESLNEKLTDPNVVNDIKMYQKISQDFSNIKDKAELAQNYISKLDELQEIKNILENETDAEMKELALDEQNSLQTEIDNLEETIEEILVETDPDDSKNIIIEIRSGTGGIEAALFAEDLFRMYSRYAEEKSWKTELMSLNENDGGGIKEAVISFKGNNVFGQMKYESGVHRVQRVPETESSGRIHTSAATVAVLPEVENIDIEINDADIKIDTYRASGAGGQHVNKTESAIRITHISSGLVVTCQDESSQHKNKDKAMKVLRARLYDLQREQQAKERADVRKSMVSTGDRSAKIRTYNFPQGRVTDHRINLTLYKLNEIINGDLNELIQNLKIEDHKSRISS
ncbi:MAG: peptide chain release factor 1 [Candidatus Marinimicrobia bacterium]|nr:peptide chain release factor 1 [Candidatus Neomarinimicrobiota bacterium]|tara:strand:+ start:276 stop:1337 length:1062 start_codon:yes stop_codon:yes gene_type:complete